MKLTLTITSGTLAGRTFDLETGFLTVGRSENCSVRFDPSTERIASKQHAFIEARPDGYYLTDNASTNGTFLNGEQIERHKLSSGDNIQFGRKGATATVSVVEPSVFAPAAGDFREMQLQQFQEAARSAEPNFQKSMANFGLGSIETVPEPSRAGRYAGIGITIFTVVFLSLIVIAILFASVGIVPAVIASVVAFVPAILYLLPLIWLDRYDPEPLWLLSLAFAWGALVAVIASFVINTVVGTGIAVVVGGAEGAYFGNVIGAVVSAPVFEEGSKGIGLLVLLIFFRKYFDDILDGIVFAGVIALGFATVENVMYYGTALGTTGIGGLIILFFMRGILSPFAHVTFTSMTGIGCGLSRESHNKAVRILAPIFGYCVAVFLHAFWNGMAVVGGFESFLVGYLILEIPFFLLIVGFAFYIMHRQNKILREMLAIDVARGLIPAEHFNNAVSAFKSSGWLIGGLFSGKYRPRSRYLRAIGKLGLSYWHIQRATAAQGQTGSFQQNPILREEVLKWRDKVD
ncbi:MAG: PrsW family glutamic-type intramembrane protease [Acidobacteriota bacterium]